MYSTGDHINWRERLLCPITELNNRQRANYHLMFSELHPYNSDQIYITEQASHFYSFLKQRVQNLIGSEYIDPSLKLEERGVSNLRHEDLTNLSFDNSSIDKVISFDCLEHIPEYKTALSECYRVLTPGGALLASFPFNKMQYKTFVRAEISETGVISHFTTPEYHGDPLTDQGCLSYYTFGWEVLDVLRKIGFSDVYAVLYWSDLFCYLGNEQIVFVAKK